MEKEKAKSTSAFMRDFISGAIIMLMLLTFFSDEFKQFREVKVMQKECERFLPRNEHCVIVMVPKSKD